MLLPDDFLDLMRRQWGEARAESLLQALSLSSPVVSLRLNPAKLSWRPALTPVPWCPDGYYLSERPPFTFDPLLHAGAYYVQDASSMFLAQAVSQYVSAPCVALDLCAAPGGKSTLLRSLLPEGSLLVSNEPIPKRAQILAENMTKWGHPATVVTQNYPADFAPLRHTFDLIVADVPCSGEGMFRKDEEAVAEWSMQNVRMCQERQRGIIADVWPSLKPGGLLVYSTCTFNHMENEDNVEWIASSLDAEVLPISVDASWGVVGTYHFLPGEVRGEGQFMAVLRKKNTEASAAQNYSKQNKKLQQARSKTTASLRDWLAGQFEFIADGDVCIALPGAHASLCADTLSSLHILMQGVQVATMKGHDWQPSHALAMSQAYVRGSFPEAALDYDTALAYLRRETIQVDAPRGYVLVTFRGLPLGFVKNLGSRANNLYPQEWRIRSTHAQTFTLAGEGEE
ncbi:MAG: rRNA cytosine-C5-methyltransferase [Bacteroidaceae bacterium]|nr:rRNA cytosine-C5-methyltransferase [Bacteroidaceae bacterium]